MPAVIAEPALRRAMLLAERLAGRHFAISEIAGYSSLDDGEGRLQWGVAAIEEALWVIIDRRLAVRTLANLNLTDGSSVARYTVARPGESFPRLIERHANDLIVNFPAVYMAGGFLDHISAPFTGDTRWRRHWNAARFALADAKLHVIWYPDGLPSLWNPLQGAALEHFKGYCAALRKRAGEYVFCTVQGPRRLERELAASRLPCRPERDPAPLPQRGEPTALPTSPLLWMPLGDRRRPSTLYLVHSRSDPVSNQEERIIGVAALTLADLATARLYRQKSLLHVCCPEVNGWSMPTSTGRVRFHLVPGPLPAIPTVRRRPPASDGPETTPLRPLGWLSPATFQPASAPRPGLLLWGDSTGARAWEEVAQDHLTTAIAEGRSWTSHLDHLAWADGHVLRQAPDGTIRNMFEANESVIRKALGETLPYCMSERLTLI